MPRSKINYTTKQECQDAILAYKAGDGDLLARLTIRILQGLLAKWRMGDRWEEFLAVTWPKVDVATTKFDVEKGNAFAYLTTAIRFAILAELREEAAYTARIQRFADHNNGGRPCQRQATLFGGHQGGD